MSIAEQLNGPLTALVLYIHEIKRHSDRISETEECSAYLRQLTNNAVQQTENICALVKIAVGAPPESCRCSASQTSDVSRPSAAALEALGDVLYCNEGQKALTKRQREALIYIVNGYSNKQAALLMEISPRTFEDHRAAVIRSLKARNTADLVRQVVASVTSSELSGPIATTDGY